MVTLATPVHGAPLTAKTFTPGVFVDGSSIPAEYQSGSFTTRVGFDSVEFGPGLTNAGKANLATGSWLADEGNAYFAQNTAKDESCWVKYKKGARIGDKLYDMKIYMWSDSAVPWTAWQGGLIGNTLQLHECASATVTDKQVYNISPSLSKQEIESITYKIGNKTISYNKTDLQKAKINMEFHFYDGATEVNFKGLGFCNDLDGGHMETGLNHTKLEGIAFSNGVVQTYLSQNTKVFYTPTNGAKHKDYNNLYQAHDVNVQKAGWFVGTEEVMEAIGSTRQKDTGVFYTINATPSSPLRLSYNNYGDFGMALISYGVPINYYITQNSAYNPNKKIATDYAIPGSKYKILNRAPDNGNFAIKGWYESSQAKVTGNPVSEITVPEGGKTIYGEYQPKVTITGDAGVATVTNSAIVDKGKDYPVTITLKTGYEIAKITVDGTETTQENLNNLLKNIQKNKTVNITTRKKKYTVTTTGTHATITATAQVEHGANHTVTYGPEAGYHLTSVKVDGTARADLLTKTSITFTGVVANHTVEAVAEKDFEITTSSSNATIDAKVTGIKPGASKTVNFRANDGFHITSVTVDGKVVTPTTATSHTFTNINENHTISVAASTDYEITTRGTNVTIDPTAQNIKPGSSKTINYRANDGYHITSVKVDNVAQAGYESKTSFAFSNINASHVIEVTAEKDFEIVTSATNATIDPKVTGLKPGSSKAVSFASNQGYHLVSVTVDGKLQDPMPSSPFTFSNITSNRSISVVATKDFAITTSAVHARVTPAITGIKPGANHTISFEPEDGCKIVSVKLDGKPVDINKPVEIKNVQSDHAVEVTGEYMPKIDTIMENGTITQASRVDKGTDYPVEYKVNEGYMIDQILFDDEPVEAEGLNELLTNIQEDHKVEVKTRKIPNLQVVKRASKEGIVDEDTVSYTITVDQIVEDALATNVILTDMPCEEGKVKMDTIKVTGMEEGTYTVIEKNGGFTIEAGELGYGKPVEITYDVEFTGLKELKDDKDLVNRVVTTYAENDTPSEVEATIKKVVPKPVEKPAVELKTGVEVINPLFTGIGALIGSFTLFESLKKRQK